jgi:DNA-binding PadR family transcriptional regulator
LARKKCKGTRLEVFSGKQESLNRVILQVLERRGPLIAYDVWRQLKVIKGFRDTDSKTIYRRMEALEQQGWIAQKGTRHALPGWDSTLYELTLRGKAALKLDKKNIEDFLRTANDEQLLRFIDSYS